MSETNILTICTALDAKVAPYDWPFARTHEAAISAYWAQEIAKKPAMFNGRVLMLKQLEHSGDRLTTVHFETDYAAMLYYLRSGAADGTAHNGFAMAALTSAEGHLLLGRMAAHTANGGQVYSPGGTPDRNDIRGDTLDLAGSLLRELHEETGIAPDDVTCDPYWVIIQGRMRCAFMKVARSPLPATVLRERIMAFLARESEPELSDILIASSPLSLANERVPSYMRAYIDWWFAEGRSRHG